MALIGTIRKNFWFVLIVLGLALAAFILMDMTGAAGPGGATSLTMGSVAGEKIDYRTFQRTEQSYYGGSTGDPFSKRKTIWDFYVQNSLINKESDRLGLSISKAEMTDLVFGANPHEIIRRNNTNPQTGQFDPNQLGQYKQLVDSGENPEFRAYWAEQEKQIRKERLQSKLNAIVSKSVYTPNWMAEESFNLDNNKVDFNYVKIPFDKIDGSGITVSDADINNFIASKQSTYELNEQTRVIEYATFEVLPSGADSANIQTKLSGLKTEFINSENDSLFTISNNGSYTHLYAKEDQLPAGARGAITSLNPGEVYGPIAENGFYIIVKMLDKKKIADTVEARHILRRSVRTDAASVASARSVIDSLRRELRRGISFDTLAARHSEDLSNAATGGKLGRFTQESMVPEFATACFANGKVSGVYTVTTDYGVHLLEVTDNVFNDNNNKYRIATIAQPITPSQETQDIEYDRVTEIVSANRDVASMREAINAVPGVLLERSAPLKANDFTFGTLAAAQSSREMIKWAYDPSTEVGDVSPEIYRFTDRVNYYDNKYIIASLNSIIPKGLPTAASMRSSLETRVMNKMKAEKFASGFNYTSINEAASSQGLTVENVADVSSKATVVNGIGNEPSVIAAAFSTAVQAVSKPIVGESGVYVIQPLSKQEPGTPTSLPMLKTGISRATKSQIDFSLIQNMTKRADIKDDRSTFF